MNDIELAECLDAILRAWRAGERDNFAQLRDAFPELESENQVIDFFVGLCRAADDWRTPSTGIYKPDTIAEFFVDTPSVAGSEPTLSNTFGRYEIRSRVASGGMGTVYRAYDPTLDRTVALKVPHLDAEHPRFESLAEQFVQEARLAASVDHPNVCAVHDAGRHDGTPYVVMAYVDGETLAARLKAARRYEDVEEAVTVVRQVAEGLAAAHQRRIVHRDVKPGNILLRASDGRPILTDFGLARVAQEGGGVTRPGIVAGTLAYMAPEQAAGKPTLVGPHTDVYALGVVLYQMVTGRLPFQGDLPTMFELIRAAEPNPASHHRPDLNPAVEAVIRKAMAKNSKDRYPDASAFVTELARLTPESSSHNPATVSFSTEPVFSGPRKRWRPIFLAALLVTAAAIALWFAVDNRTAPLPPLDGDLLIRVSTDPTKLRFDQAVRPRVNVLVDDRSREALPVRNIDLVTIEVRLSRPAYAYVFWFPGEGGPPSPIYPWDPHPESGFRVAPNQARVTSLRSPPQVGKGWPITGPSGLETAVLLGRDEPLTEAQIAELREELGVLPPTLLGADLQECAWLDPISSRGTLRGVNTGEARDLVDEPVFSLLRRLRPRFPLVKAVRFAHLGETRDPVPVRGVRSKGINP